jgi:hypothetical protein
MIGLEVKFSKKNKNLESKKIHQRCGHKNKEYYE